MSVFGKDEAAISKFAAGMPLPEFDVTSFNPPISLNRAKIAIVTTAALHRLDRDGFEPVSYTHLTLPTRLRV